MMFRDTPDGTIAIPQPSHAWISGQIMRAWGNAEFGVVAPFEDVCLAAEQHDIGWLMWEQAPTVNPATGRPHGFRDLGVLRHTAIWTLGTAMAGVFGRYPALLVSLHGTGLYASFDAAAASADEADAARAFLEAQQAIQRRLLCSLATDPRLAPYAAAPAVERNRGLVQDRGSHVDRHLHRAERSRRPVRRSARSHRQGRPDSLRCHRYPAARGRG